ncbi:MAG TPA: bifunctional 3,4-dihydroxy-2-butanone-4-phosphate synthase/GTP cyclohydrolase II [Dehalococcoidales bacterium]|nr:MAG: bifunctional 3,4-dihydroxy-2-butanone 4-phosphate synthase/GTP cyclohydrolase II [Chloroflexi bacterium RBG_16_60_22]HJX12075.1 bifunctional 3,4-dihydroxy-2-butanone-4-phosphate synthase/GTP cyclohydrolase II [Dehalococcoidales bacterium]
MVLATIPEAIEDIKNGKFVIVVDDEDRENEGDFVMAAEKVTPEAINFMAVHGRGLICMPVTGERLDELKIPMMASNNTSKFTTAFAVSVEAKHGTSTGISAADRATTVHALIDPATRPEDIVMPGHMFPLRARDGGVLVRAGQTEATVDLARLAGLYPAGVCCEIMNEDGTMARLPQLEAIARRFDLKIISVADLIAYRYRHEKLVHRVAEARLPTPYGNFTVIAYRSQTDAAEHIALVMGDVATDEPVLVRVHSQCLTGDVFDSLRCDCGDQIKMAMEKIAGEGRGVVLYMRQEGRGIGIHNKIKAYALQDAGMDTVEANLSLGFAADLRDYGIGAQILAELGLRHMRLMTNNPKKMSGLESYGLKITEIVPLVTEPNPHNRRYLQTKQKKLGHLLKVADSTED